MEEVRDGVAEVLGLQHLTGAHTAGRLRYHQAVDYLAHILALPDTKTSQVGMTGNFLPM